MIGKGETSRISTYKMLVFRVGTPRGIVDDIDILAAWSVSRNDRSNPKERLQLKEVMAVIPQILGFQNTFHVRFGVMTGGPQTHTLGLKKQQLHT